jgi:spoIIIJ-associated protein
MEESPVENRTPASAMQLQPHEVLAEIIRRMGYEVEVESSDGEEQLLINISGKDAGVLIGKKGQTLDALQFILNKVFRRDVEDHKPIVVDSGGYRQRRTEALVQLAQRLSEKATRTGKIVAVNPMSAHDRRIIHLALKETPGISTRSEGEGIYRRLLIVPEPE